MLSATRRCIGAITSGGTVPLPEFGSQTSFDDKCWHSVLIGRTQANKPQNDES